MHYATDGQGVIYAGRNNIARDIETNPTSGADIRRLVHRANSAPDLLRAGKAVLAAWEAGDLAAAVRDLAAAIERAEGET